MCIHDGVQFIYKWLKLLPARIMPANGQGASPAISTTFKPLKAIVWHGTKSKRYRVVALLFCPLHLDTQVHEGDLLVGPWCQNFILMESTVPNDDKPEVEGVPTGPGATSEAEPSNFGMSFASSRTTGAPPETSGATATPVKPYTPVSAAQSSAITMSSVNKCNFQASHLIYQFYQPRLIPGPLVTHEYWNFLSRMHECLT
jgi:hypothetical protein